MGELLEIGVGFGLVKVCPFVMSLHLGLVLKVYNYTNTNKDIDIDIGPIFVRSVVDGRLNDQLQNKNTSVPIFVKGVAEGKPVARGVLCVYCLDWHPSTTLEATPVTLFL